MPVFIHTFFIMAEAPPSPSNDIVNDDDDEYLKIDVPVSNRSLDPPMVAAMPLEQEPRDDDEESMDVIQAHAIIEDDSQINPSCITASAASQNVPMNVEAVHIDEAPEEEEPDQHKSKPKRRYYKWFGILFVGLILGAVLASIPAILKVRRSINENEEANDAGATGEGLVPSVAPFSCPALQHSKTRSFPLDRISFDYFDVTPNVAVLSSPMSPLGDAYFATLPFESNTTTRKGHDDNYDILKLLLLDDDRLLMGLSNHTTDEFGNENRTGDSIAILFYNSTTLEWENKGLILLGQDHILLDLASNKFGDFFAAIVLDESELPALQFVGVPGPDEALFLGQFTLPALSNNSKIHVSQQNQLAVYTDDGYLQLFDGSTGSTIEEKLDLGAGVEEDGMLVMDDLQASESFDVFLVVSNLPGAPCYVASRATNDSVPLWAPLLPNATIQVGSLSSSGEFLVLATSHLESDQSRNVASIYRRDDGNDWSVIETIELVNGALRGVFLDDDDRMVVITNDILQVYQLDCVQTTDDVPSLAPSHRIDDTLPSAVPSCQSTFESVDSSPVAFDGNRFDRVVMTSKRAVFAYGQQGYFQTHDYDGDTISVTDSFQDEVYDIISMELAMDNLVLALSEYDTNLLVDNMPVKLDAVVVLKRNDTTWEPMSSIVLGFEHQFLQVVTNAFGNFFSGVTIDTSEATSLQFASVNHNDESMITNVGHFSLDPFSHNTLISMSQGALLVVYTDDGTLTFYDGGAGLFEDQGFIKLGAEIPDGESLVMDDLQSSESFDVFMVLSHTPDTPVYVGTRRDESCCSEAIWALNRPNTTKQMGSLSSDGASLVLATSYGHDDGKNRNVASIYRSQDWTRVVETIELMDGELRGIHLADDRMVVATNDMLQVYQVECVVT